MAIKLLRGVDFPREGAEWIRLRIYLFKLLGSPRLKGLGACILGTPFSVFPWKVPVLQWVRLPTNSQCVRKLGRADRIRPFWWMGKHSRHNLGSPWGQNKRDKVQHLACQNCNFFLGRGGGSNRPKYGLNPKPKQLNILS